MFSFFKKLKAPAILEDCEKELHRASVADVYFLTPRDVQMRAELLRKAAAAGLAEHETVKRLDFLQRLLTAVTADPEPSRAVQDALLAEAAHYQLEKTSAARQLREHRELELLEERGPRVVAHDQQGRAVYFQCSAEFKNKSGQFAVREDGLTFTGEVVIEVAFNNVVHAAKTTHNFQGMDYKAIALQEGKRRTPTKFVFLGHEAARACEVTMRLWEQSKNSQV